MNLLRFALDRRPRAARALIAGLLAAVIALAAAAPAGALSGQQSRFLGLAEQGVAQARSAFADNAHGLWNGKRNVPISWYDERLHVTGGYPLATIWGAVPLWESLVAVAQADPTPANRAALDAFAEGPGPRAAGPVGLAARAGTARAALAGTAAKRKRKSHRKRKRGSSGRSAILKGAESYWDGAVGGYAPYPGDRGTPNVWFDDNAWWGLAFMDTYRVLGNPRFLQDAQNAFSFDAHKGWDAAGGGLWWNTAHTPNNQKSGEALAAGALLGTLLAQAYQQTGQTATANYDLQTAEQWLSWGDQHFADPASGLYWRTQDNNTPMPYITGPPVEAKQLLCQLAPKPNPYCSQAAKLASAAYQRFADRLNMGPQFDTIYLHWMLVYGQQTGDGRWAALATGMANQALAHAKDPSTGLYERAWDGSNMSAHQADPNMLRTDAATVELFGWLAADGP